MGVEKILQKGLVLLFLSIPVMAVAGATIYVATNGNDANSGTYSEPVETIHQALILAAEGDSIIIGEGSFTAENENVSFSCSIRGAGKDKTVIVSAADDSALFTMSSGVKTSFADLSAVYQNTLTAQTAIISCSSGSNSFVNCRFVSSETNAMAIDAFNIQGLTVNNCEITGFSYGITADSGENVIIKDNEITADGSCSGTGISIQNITGGDISGTIIRGYSDVAGNSGTGLWVSNSKVNIHGMRISSNCNGCVLSRADEWAQFYDNDIYDCSGIGLTSRYIIPQITFNTVYDCDTAFSVVLTNTKSRDFVLNNNIFYGSVQYDIEIEAISNFVLNVVGCYESSYVLDDVGAIQVTYQISDWPGFVDAEHGNFELESDSPCIDVGIDYPVLERIYYGENPDFGAHEYYQVSGYGDITLYGANESAVELTDNYLTSQDESCGIQITDLLSKRDEDMPSDDSRSGAHVIVTVYSANGYTVRSLFDGSVVTDSLELEWDGCDDAGNYLPSNAYYIVVNIDGTKTTKKVLVVR